MDDENTEPEEVKDEGVTYTSEMLVGGILSAEGVSSVSGSHISITPEWSTYPSTITTSPAMPSVSKPRKKPVPSKFVDAPKKSPRKILVAFLGPDDEVEWCAKVHPRDVQVDMDPHEPAVQMTLTFWLIEAE